MNRRALVLVVAFACSSPALFAQSQRLSADEKELASYRLTMANVKKAGNVMKAFAEIEAADPKNRAKKQLEDEENRISAEMQKLEEKEELTTAEQARLEKLNEQMDALAQKRMAAEETEDKDTDTDEKKQPQTLAEWEAMIRKEPRVAAVLNREGISAHDFARTMLTLMQASIVVGFSQGKVDFAKLPAGINPDNVKFVLENKDVLEAMEKEQDRKQ